MLRHDSSFVIYNGQNKPKKLNTKLYENGNEKSGLG